jgi:C4-dicarboxylate-specific signal transduction histidine kinase
MASRLARLQVLGRGQPHPSIAHAPAPSQEGEETGPTVFVLRSLAARYGLALGFVGLALVLTLAMQPFVAGRPTLFLFFAAILASAWFGGVGPGGVAVMLSLPAGLYFYAGDLRALPLTTETVLLALFCTVCAIVGGALNSRQQRADGVLAAAHRELEAKAHELEETNKALLAQNAERERAELALQSTQMELTRVARLTTMGELAASIAHELNQPIAAAVTSAGSCLRWLDADPPNLDMARRSASRIVRDCNRASDVVTGVRAMVRKALPEKRLLDINETVAKVLPLVQGEIDRNAVRVQLCLAPGLPRVSGDPIQLQQVVLNLVLNATEALAGVDRQFRHLTISSQAAAGAVEITVADTGDGVRNDERDTLFEAFVTTKPDGMGLGLSICRTIVEAHGGTLRLCESVPRGATFRVQLPAAEEESR